MYVLFGWNRFRSVSVLDLKLGTIRVETIVPKFVTALIFFNYFFFKIILNPKISMDNYWLYNHGEYAIYFFVVFLTKFYDVCDNKNKAFNGTPRRENKPTKVSNIIEEKY